MKNLKFTTGIPPLILIGTIIVIFPIFVFMTIDRINKQKAQSIKLLLEKSTALIRAFEAGTYTGMMNMGWSSSAMENLLSETAALPDIAYLFLVNQDGITLAHNQKEKIGMAYGRKLDFKTLMNAKQSVWRIITDNKGSKVFEVHKKFSPTNRTGMSGSRGMMTMHQRMHANTFKKTDTYENTVIFVGLDMESIVQADKSDTQHTIMMAVILALIGFTGFVLVFIVQRYAQTRSSLSKIQIFSDNLVENMPVGLIAIDMNNQILSVNPAASSILSSKPDDRAGNIAALIPGEIEKMLASIWNTKDLVEKEIHIKDMIDMTIILDVIASPLYDKQGDPLGALLILRDKTELNRLKTEMEHNKRLAAIGRLAAGVAHEIRNPLSSLKGYATFFKETFDAGSENYGIADVMTKEVDRLNRVVSELVELAKPVAVSGKPIDLEALVLECTQLISYEPGAENITIKTKVETNLPKIHADADRLKQVVLNLCLNALQAMDGSGNLDIQLKKSKTAENIIIIVSDTGCGMETNKSDNIFEPYFTTKISGTGLGLAIVHNIIKAHKGRIDVKSEPGKGTVFSIILPMETS
ncbi:MAG: ATP-binding protein [Deltaproteobacteria bacterium]|jgi:two-component system sensor histidine kinase HydH|nr:ATP-binding protein [Deltaproteobacteria bacterium]